MARIFKEARIGGGFQCQKKIRKITPDRKFEEVILKYYVKQIAAEGLDQHNESKLYFK